jgi:hypothetical protein
MLGNLADVADAVLNTRSEFVPLGCIRILNRSQETRLRNHHRALVSRPNPCATLPCALAGPEACHSGRRSRNYRKHVPRFLQQRSTFFFSQSAPNACERRMNRENMSKNALGLLSKHGEFDCIHQIHVLTRCPSNLLSVWVDIVLIFVSLCTSSASQTVIV